MNAATIITAPVDRVANWFRRAGPGMAERVLDARARYDAIGDFLFEHGLEPDAANSSFARAYLEGKDDALCASVNALLRVGARITPSDVMRISGEAQASDRSLEALDVLARQLEARVGECVEVIGESFASTSEYSRALDLAAAGLRNAPDLAYGRLVALTRDVVVTTRKISDRMERMHADTQRLQDELEVARRAAEEDHLTGLLNRRGFLERVDALVAAQPGAVRTIALCDIDDFKVVNDRHGHEVGDRVLSYVARQLRGQLDADVLVARYGGEEFVCLFDGVPPDAAAAMLDEVRDTLRARSLREQNSGEPIGTITFSAGVASLLTDRAQAFREADAALYTAKHGGKDRVQIAIPPRAGSPRRPDRPTPAG